MAKELVSLHHQLTQDDQTQLQRLRAAASSGAQASQRQHVSASQAVLLLVHSVLLMPVSALQMDNDGTLMEEDGSDSSSSASEGADSARDMEVDTATKAPPRERVVDDDGFELVQTRRRH